MGPDKNSFAGWWICIFLAFLLWYRNNGSDRIFGSIFFVVGFLQLIDYGVKGGMNRSHAGKLVYLSLWLVCLVVSVAVYIYTKSSIVGAMAIFFLIIFVIASITVFTPSIGSLNPGYSPRVAEYHGGFYDWILEPVNPTVKPTIPILGSYSWLWALGIIIPSLVLVYYTKDASLMLLLIFALATYIICKIISPQSTASVWAYTSILILFFAWGIGMFTKKSTPIATSLPVSV